MSISDTFKKFPSLAHPDKYGYIYDSGAWRSHAPVDMHMLMFETYGHGLTQHSPEQPIGEEFLADYLHSLAAAMLGDDELTTTIAWRFPEAIDPARIAFAASVKDEETTYYKPRYFSIMLRRFSSLRSKENDKRFERITSRHDGSAKAVFDMLLAEYARGLERFILADAVRTWMNRSPDHGYGSMEEPTKFLDWRGGWSEADKHLADRVSSDIRQGIDLIRSITEAHRLLHNAKQYLANYRERVEAKPAPPEAPIPTLADDAGRTASGNTPTCEDCDQPQDHCGCE